jgi:hypothetical protein
MAMSLTKVGEMSVGDVSVYVDEKLPKPPEKEESLSFRENYARLFKYLRPILKASKPVSIGFRRSMKAVEVVAVLVA